MLKKLDLNNNPYLGVFCRANEEILLAPPTAHEGTLYKIAEALEVELVPYIVGSCTLIGSLICLNSNGAVLPNFATKNDVNNLERTLRADILNDKLNALGNNILANDNGAIVNPEYSKRSCEFISDILGVKVARGTIAGHKTVGAAAVATNKGVLCHPHATEKELKTLEEILSVPASIGTLDYGTPMIGACLVANNKGAVVGTPTTTIEIGRLEEALDIY